MFFDEFPEELKKKIKEETTFLYDGVQLSFNLEKVGLEYRKVLMRFNIYTFEDIVKKILAEKFYFDGLLLDSNISLKCYRADIEKMAHDRDVIRVGIVGEVTGINAEE